MLFSWAIYISIRINSKKIDIDSCTCINIYMTADACLCEVTTLQLAQYSSVVHGSMLPVLVREACKKCVDISISLQPAMATTTHWKCCWTHVFSAVQWPPLNSNQYYFLTIPSNFAIFIISQFELCGCDCTRSKKGRTPPPAALFGDVTE